MGCLRARSSRSAVNVFYVLHDIAKLDVDPVADGFAAVIAGHSHKPGVTEKNGVLFVNPGSAGPRRFNLPVAVAQDVHRQHGSPR